MDSFLTKSRLTGAVVLTLAGLLLAFWLRPELPEPEVRTHELLLPGQTAGQPGYSELSEGSLAEIRASQSGAVIRSQPEPLVSEPPAIVRLEPDQAPVVAVPPVVSPPIVKTPVAEASTVVVNTVALPSVPDSAVAGEVWVVQVAAFAAKARAEALQLKLQPLSAQTYVESVKINDAAMYRVRIGPFTSEVAAQGMSAKVLAKLAMQAKVYKLQKLSGAAAS